MLPTPPTTPDVETIQPEKRLGQKLNGRLELTGVLGVGAYGVVYTARDTYSGVPYAVKALNKTGLDRRQKDFQWREIQLHSRAGSHPNVVSLVDVIESLDCTFVVLEFCPEGDLFTKITEQGHYVGNDVLAKYIFLQILDAVIHCHAVGVYHRDIKPENVLVSNAGMTVQLADFGLATTDPVSLDFGCGSTFYMSPECQEPSSRPYSTAANDVWSLGVLLVNLTCGRNPWKKANMKDSTFRGYVKSPGFLRSILPISAELDAILGAVFQLDPRRRISLLDLRVAILRCNRFTTDLPAPSSLSSPPWHPADHDRDAIFQPGRCVLGGPTPSFSPLDGYENPASDLSARFSELSTRTGSGTSSTRSDASSRPPVPTSEFHSQASLRPAAYLQATEAQQVSPTAAWFTSFAAIPQLAQKHLSFQPCRVRVPAY